MIIKWLRTAFIGPLADFETEFGNLWGAGKPYTKLTPDEKRWYARWEIVRKKILDRGNQLIRQAKEGGYGE